MNNFTEAKKEEIFVDKIKRVMHGDGWGYELTLNDNDDYLFSIAYLEYDNEKKEYTKSNSMEISTLIIRRLAEEILSMLPESNHAKNPN